jgi:ATP-dependent DNA helicase RecG
MIQLDRQKEKQKLQTSTSYPITTPEEKLQEFVDRFEFELTDSQTQSINDIYADIQKTTPMSRLLEGDVGSGKTAVAASTAFAVVSTKPKGQSAGSLQVAYMAPTEILAKQHFESFIQLFRHMPVSIALITGKGCRKFPSKVNVGGWTDISRTQLLKWVANGDIAIVIGTHALIQKSVKFKHLACVVIDEQHRFGVEQRKKLVKKNDQIPHLLSMTATPIPRTLALTLYGDLDLSLLDGMPTGRKPIITDIVTPHNRKAAYEHIREQVKSGRQAYIICPRIDEPDESTLLTLVAKAVKTEAKRLQKEVFPEYRIGIIHSKMKPDEKEDIMSDFSAQKIDILVSTSVIEVGVNVPNATTILIEGAERFGLAQLHQLRGRVIRGNHQAYCFLATDSETETAVKRLTALKNTRSGFDLAELDLKERGAGSLSTGKQWGITDIGMEALKNIKMVEAARKEATAIIQSDPELKNHPLLEMVLRTRGKIHFE